MQVRFSGPARDDFIAIVLATLAIDTQRAQNIRTDVATATGLLRSGWAQYPIVARSRLGDVRKIKCRPFVLLYRVTDSVEILAVAHERSDWVRAIADF